MASAACLLLGGLVTATLTHGGGVEVRQRVEAFVRAWDAARPKAAADPAAGPLWGATHAEEAAMVLSVLEPMLRTLKRSRSFHGLTRLEAIAERTAARSAMAPMVALAQRLAHSSSRVQSGMWHATNQVLEFAQLDAWDRGDVVAVVGHWLDAARIWRDARFDGIPWLLSPMWPEDRVRRLDLAAARLLADGLARLDASWPPHTDVPAFLVSRARSALAGGPTPGRMSAMRRGYFTRADAELAACDAFITRLPMIREPAVGLVARQRQWTEWATGGGDWSWTFVGSRLGHLSACETSHLRGIAEVRLLRLALAFRLGEPLPDLVDPLTGGRFDIRIEGDVASFRTSADGDSLVRWSERRR